MRNITQEKEEKIVGKSKLLRKLVRRIDCSYDKHYNKCHVLRVEEELKGSHGDAFISV